MNQINRLKVGGRIDRSKPLVFHFNGKPYQGYQGDSLASALLANGVDVVGRSFKYSRPRGIIGCGAEEPNAVLQVGEGAATIPNLRATQTELYQDLKAFSVNGWPNVDFDITAAMGWFGRLMPPGFYYKTFMAPQKLWMTYEHFIRKAAGFGKCPSEPDPDHYDKMNHHCDVMVVGAGPTGLAAALEATRSGARVILVDEQSEFGGSLLGSKQLIDGLPAMQWVTSVIEELEQCPNIQLLPRSTAFGYYDHNFLAVLERRTDHLGPVATQSSRQRIHRIRARRVVLATGAIERPLVFGNNDRPGVMLASAVSSYINRYAVIPGRKAVVFTSNDSAYQTAIDLHEAGRKVVAVVDSRANPQGRLPALTRSKGIEVISGHGVIDVKGKKRVKAALIAPFDETGQQVRGKVRTLDCDLIAVSGGWSPVIHLNSHTGAKPVWSDEKIGFLPGESPWGNCSAGACNGSYSLADCLSAGAAAGIEAAQLAGVDVTNRELTHFRTEDEAEQKGQALFMVPHLKKTSRAPKQFVDFQLDVTASGIELAAREGYESVEHVKRYTAMGFGTDQGKLGNINGMAILAKALGQSIPETGTTIFRPAYTPTTFGAIGGRDIGVLLDPARFTAIQQWHEEQGAVFENVGQWKRPWYFPKPGESMQDAANRECLAVRESVGMGDASTLGKIDIQGPDAAEFLNRIYTNAWSKLAIGKCRYGLMLHEDGMVFDDGVTARLGENHYLMTTTTGGAAGVMSWLELWLQTEWPELEVYLTSVTDHWSTVQLSGPNARKVMEKVCDDIDFSKDAFQFMDWCDGTVAGVKARVFRISFTGELSFEVNVQSNQGRYVWEKIYEAGREFNITPYGTEAIHILRAEKGFIIVGQDTDGSMTPVDLGMEWAMGKKKEFSYLGKRSLDRSDCVRNDRKQLVGLLTSDPKTVLPEGAQIVGNPRQTIPMTMQGHVTSSYYSASLGRSIAMAVVKGGLNRMGDTIYCPLSDGSTVAAEIVSPVFYDPKGERQNV